MKKIRCALYPRVSTEEQFINGLSLPAQVDDLTSYAKRMDYDIVGIYADEGISARKPVSKRPALLRLLEDVKQNKIDIILVTKLDRWFRNIKEYQITQEILERHNCFWKTIFEDYDTSTANGQMVVNIMLAVAQNECDRGSERIKAVLNYKVKKKEHVTGAAPYGYITVNKKLQKDPDTQHIVEDTVDFYFSCFSKRKTVYHILNKYAENEKCPSKYQINRILSEELYAGIYKGMPGYYPAYLTPDQLQLIKSSSDTKSYPHTKEPYIFSGLLRCPGCGKIMTGIRKKQVLKDGSASYYRRYRCCSKFSEKHSAPCISESVLEKYMLDHVCLELNNVICRLQNKTSAVKTSRAPEIKAELERLNIMYQKGRITDEYYETQYTELERALAKELDTGTEDIEHYIRLKKEFSGNWIDLYNMLDPAYKNAFWKRIIKQITFDETTHKVSGFYFV